MTGAIPVICVRRSALSLQRFPAKVRLKDRNCILYLALRVQRSAFSVLGVNLPVHEKRGAFLLNLKEQMKRSSRLYRDGKFHLAKTE
jgi:hypothetical protein